MIAHTTNMSSTAVPSGIGTGLGAPSALISPRGFAGRGGETFRSILSTATQGPLQNGSIPGEATKEKAADSRRAAEDFIAQTLILPVLKQLRETNQAAAPFAPGDAERQFMPMYDEMIAQQIVRAKHFPLVDSVARHLLGRSGEHESSKDSQPRANGLTGDR